MVEIRSGWSADYPKDVSKVRENVLEYLHWHSLHSQHTPIQLNMIAHPEAQGPAWLDRLVRAREQMMQAREQLLAAEQEFYAVEALAIEEAKRQFERGVGSQEPGGEAGPEHH